MPERKMSRCFMNGKSCIYERDIDEIINSRTSTSRKKTAFVMMPYGDQLNVLFKWEIAPFLQNGGGDPKYECAAERADDVRQVGFIICEKICRKIQEADYVAADLTFDNPNVFYELGLATALRKEILPICDFGKTKERLQLIKPKLGITEMLTYPAFDMMVGHIQDHIWKLDPFFNNFEQMSGDHVTVLFDSRHRIRVSERYEDEYDFGSLCKTAVGTAITSIFDDKNIANKPELSLYCSRIKDINNVKSVDLSKATFRDIIDACIGAACVLIDVSAESAITNFFWLGYIHGIGGNAVPINSFNPDREKEKQSPFDIRALWHIKFQEDRPEDLLRALQQILEHIFIRKARYLNREEFWKEILKDNKVSIFLGSLYLNDLGRNTIGDWDYRTAAEITNYLSMSKETIKVTLESPLPKMDNRPDAQHLQWLENQLKDKNSIIVASADVNDLTEVALCRILGGWPPFKTIPESDINFRGYIAYKEYRGNPEQKFSETAFYIRQTADKDSRGFIIQDGGDNRKYLKMPHTYPGSHEQSGVKKLFGQLVVARNPWTSGKWIVIISGISGPATLGIAQMLTGCMYKEFTINSLALPPDAVMNPDVKNKILFYRGITEQGMPLMKDEKDKVPYDALSETMLSKLLTISKISNGQVNALVSVDVYYPPNSISSYSNDDRRVIGWEFPSLTEVMRRKWKNPNDLGCTNPEKDEGG